MFAFSVLCIVIIGFCAAVPLESPSSDQASPVLVELAPSPVIETSEPLPNLEILNNELGPSSDVLQYFDPRIIGGSDAPDIKHMVALLIGVQMKSFTCGGSLISPRHILTAAHCIYKDWTHGGLLESYHGIVGSNTWNDGGFVVEFESHLDHPEYNGAAIKNDCSVIKTKKEVQLSHRVQPIRLDFDWVGGDVPCYATGWGAKLVWGGAAELLQILHVQTVSEDNCKKLITDVFGPGSSTLIDYKLEICGFLAWGHGMCFGDSGSALVSVRNKKQVGIVSWGWPCGVGVPDIFVRVSAMEPFITNAIKN